MTNISGEQCIILTWQAQNVTLLQAMKTFYTVLASAMLGLTIWWIDSRPHWDDTGITVGLVIIATGLISFINPKKPFICAIATSLWIPLDQTINNQNYLTLLVFVFGFMGAYAGSFLRRRVFK